MHKWDVYSQETAIESIAGMAVLLPTFLSIMRGQENWQAAHVTKLYADHTAWDAAFVFSMLEILWDHWSVQPA